MKVYSSYRPVSADWYSEVPEHWQNVRVKHLSPILRGASPRPIDDPKYFDERGEYGWVRIADVSASDGSLRYTPQMLSSLGSSLSVKLHPGDLFLSIAGSVGKPCILDMKACIHDGFVYFPHLSLPAKWLYYIFSLGNCFGGLGKMGTQLNLNTETVGNINTPLPSIHEVSQIVEYLDYETAKIDALIDEQKRLIELLKEKRQSVISHAVTKGLNPDAPMKDSGVEWLGEAPKHWLCGSLGYYSRIETGSTPDRSNPEYWGGDIPWIKTGEVNYQTIFNSEESITLLATKESSVRLAPPGTLLMAMYGQGVTRGRVAILGVHATFNQACAAITVNHKLKVEFLELYLKFAYSFIRDVGNETSQMNLNASYVAKIPIVVPPLEEQEQLVKTVNEAVLKLSSLETESKTLSETLKERRSALISAAVTGKIDVRDWQPPAGSDTVDSNASVQTERHYG